jgi:hypothetical protein
MRHGFQREVYVCEMVKNAAEVLKGINLNPDYSDLKSVKEISKLAKERWIIPRAFRNPEYRNYKKETFLENLKY